MATRRPSVSDKAGAAEAAVEQLRRSAKRCRACPLWRNATQTVFGEGPPQAAIMLVGEQPGDREDIEGRPFVGPAGRVLSRALEDAGLARESVYVTNAVKHFKFEPRGKRRLHKRPSDAEIAACHDWLDAEIATVKPSLVIALGATAARSLTGRATAIEANRGKRRDYVEGTELLITVHPSFLLRMPESAKAAAYRRFVADLRLARR